VQGVTLGLQEYIKRRKEAGTPEEAAGYAFSGDMRVLETMRKVKPVELAVAATVRLYYSMFRNQLLGQSVLVTDRQFPNIHQLGQRCSETLGLGPQQLYIVQALGSLNAGTFGTSEESAVVLNSATVDHMTEQELLFVIGHEFGHIQNAHVVYRTALYYLLNMANVFVQWIVAPAVLALNHWSRRAEITADRAGLLCCRDLEAAERVMVKFAIGSQQLFEQLDKDEYLKQYEQGKASFGRLAEMGQSHPYLTKRIQSLRMFAESAYYRKQLGLDGGLTKAALDTQVSDLVKVW
jgi:Zn-dependent protease with chaperone function